MIIHIDMDGVMCQLKGKRGLSLKETYKKAMQDNPGVAFPPPIPGFFENLDPIPGAIDAVNQLRSWADVYILTSPSVKNPHCYMEKRIWIEKHFDLEFCKRMIITAHKELVKGDILIDDYTHGKGQDKFEGRLIHFGSELYPDWDAVLDVLRKPDWTDFFRQERCPDFPTGEELRENLGENSVLIDIAQKKVQEATARTEQAIKKVDDALGERKEKS